MHILILTATTAKTLLFTFYSRLTILGNLSVLFVTLGIFDKLQETAATSRTPLFASSRLTILDNLLIFLGPIGYRPNLGFHLHQLKLVCCKAYLASVYSELFTRLLVICTLQVVRGVLAVAACREWLQQPESYQLIADL